MLMVRKVLYISHVYLQLHYDCNIFLPWFDCCLFGLVRVVLVCKIRHVIIFECDQGQSGKNSGYNQEKYGNFIFKMKWVP